MLRESPKMGHLPKPRLRTDYVKRLFSASLTESMIFIAVWPWAQNNHPILTKYQFAMNIIGYDWI